MSLVIPDKIYHVIDEIDWFGDYFFMLLEFHLFVGIFLKIAIIQIDEYLQLFGWVLGDFPALFVVKVDVYIPRQFKETHQVVFKDLLDRLN